MAGDRNTGAPRKLDKFFLASLARDYTTEAVELLVNVMRDPTARKSDRIKSAEILCERGWGKAPQEIRLTDENGEDRKIEVIHTVVHATINNGIAVQIAAPADKHAALELGTSPGSPAAISETDSGVREGVGRP